MPTIPEQPLWSTAPLTITLVCEDREAPDCHDRVTVSVTAEDAARVSRGRPIGASRAFLDTAVPAQARGWEFSHPLAPPGSIPSGERRVCRPACLKDIAAAYHRPRPPAPAAPQGSVAWWEGCRRFGFRVVMSESGVALDRGR